MLRTPSSSLKDSHAVTSFSPIMSNPKERHYWAQLRTALTAGHWRADSPAKTPSGALLSWSELFRKFKKHCRAHDVARVASHTHTLALLISEDSPNEDEDNGVLTLGIDAECLVSQGKVERIEADYEELKSLQSSNLDVSIPSLKPLFIFFSILSNRPSISLWHTTLTLSETQRNVSLTSKKYPNCINFGPTYRQALVLLFLAQIYWPHLQVMHLLLRLLLLALLQSWTTQYLKYATDEDWQ